MGYGWRCVNAHNFEPDGGHFTHHPHRSSNNNIYNNIIFIQYYIWTVIDRKGIPINVIIGIVIIVNRRLHNPRNTFWLGIIALNLLTIFHAILRLFFVHEEMGAQQSSGNSTSSADEETSEEGLLCLSFSFLTGKPYTVLLCILLLATLDRYIGI